MHVGADLVGAVDVFRVDAGHQTGAGVVRRADRFGDDPPGAPDEPTDQGSRFAFALAGDHDLSTGAHGSVEDVGTHLHGPSSADGRFLDVLSHDFPAGDQLCAGADDPTLDDDVLARGDISSGFHVSVYGDAAGGAHRELGLNRTADNHVPVEIDVAGGIVDIAFDVGDGVDAYVDPLLRPFFRFFDLGFVGDTATHLGEKLDGSVFFGLGVDARVGDYLDVERRRGIELVVEDILAGNARLGRHQSADEITFLDHGGQAALPEVDRSVFQDLARFPLGDLDRPFEVGIHAGLGRHSFGDQDHEIFQSSGLEFSEFFDPPFGLEAVGHLEAIQQFLHFFQAGVFGGPELRQIDEVDFRLFRRDPQRREQRDLDVVLQADVSVAVGQGAQVVFDQNQVLAHFHLDVLAFFRDHLFALDVLAGNAFSSRRFFDYYLAGIEGSEGGGLWILIQLAQGLFDLLWGGQAQQSLNLAPAEDRVEVEGVLDLGIFP